MKLARVLMSLALACIVLPSAAASGPTYFEVPLGERVLRIYTVDDQPSGLLERFEFVSTRGPLRGDVFFTDQNVTLNIIVPQDGAYITWEDNVDYAELTVHYASHGLIRLQIFADNQGYLLLESTVDDCSALVASELYQTAQEAANQLGLILAGLDPSSLDTPDLAVSQTFFLGLEPLTLAPALAGCSEQVPVITDYGVCGVYLGWGDCIECCQGDDVLDSAAGSAIGVLVGLINPILGGLVSFAISEDRCESYTCTGKPGDPSPTPCYDGGGVCTVVCDENGGPSPDCPVGLICCVTEECPNPWDPSCGVCVYAPDNYCCQNPDDPQCWF